MVQGGVLWGCLVVVGVVYAFWWFWLGVLCCSLVSLCTCVCEGSISRGSALLYAYCMGLGVGLSRGVICCG